MNVALAVLGFAVLAIITRLVGDEARERLRDVPGVVLKAALLLQPRASREAWRIECEGELAEILDGVDALPITRLFKGLGYATGLIHAWLPGAVLPGQPGRAISLTMSLLVPLPAAAVAFAVSSWITGTVTVEATPLFWGGTGVAYTLGAVGSYEWMESRPTVGARVRTMMLSAVILPAASWGVLGLLAVAGLGVAQVLAIEVLRKVLLYDLLAVGAAGVGYLILTSKPRSR